MRNTRAFTLIELLVVIAIIALLIGILLPALAAAKESARKVKCMVDVSQNSIAVMSYAVDYIDKIPSYSWKPGVAYSKYPDLNASTNPAQASMNQAIDILRRRAHREDIPRLRLVNPHRQYNHLILSDYLTQQLPERTMACPSDRQLLTWQNNPTDSSQLPSGWGDAAYNMIWPYASSYQHVPAAWSLDQRPRAGEGGFQAGIQDRSDHNWIWVGKAWLGHRKLHEVVYPAMKVQYFDYYDYHTTRRGLYYAHEMAQAPVAMFDGSTRSLTTADCNPGFVAMEPERPNPTKFMYAPNRPDLYGDEPPTLNGNTFDWVIGYYRWTRGGLRGVDYGASEVDTGQKVSDEASPSLDADPPRTSQISFGADELDTDQT